MKYKFSEEQYKEIKLARKQNRDKQIDKRLQVLELRFEEKGFIQKEFVIFHPNLMYLGKWRQSLYFQVFPPFALRESSSHKLVFPGVSLR